MHTACTLFNSVFNRDSYPKEWSMDKLFNVHKKGPKMDPKNYRGISIISFLAKLYDSVLNARLCQRYKPDVEQAGSQNKRGCNEQLLVLRLLVDYARHSRQTLYITFVDFRQVYDRVNRQRLIDLLRENGCGQRMLSALAAGLKDTQSVLHSRLFKSSIGVRQGGSSSCFLFTMFVNPLIRALKAHLPDGYLQDLHSLLLMDDTVIFATSFDKMQRKLNTLNDYCSQYGMVVNESKTKYMAVNPDTPLAQLNIGHLHIEEIQTYVYLGSQIMNAPLSRQIHAHVQSKQSNRRKFTSFLSRNDNAPFYLKCKVWEAALNSPILYSCESWMSSDVKCAEQVYSATLKEMLAKRNQTPADICMIEAGVAPP